MAVLRPTRRELVKAMAEKTRADIRVKHRLLSEEVDKLDRRAQDLQIMVRGEGEKVPAPVEFLAMREKAKKLGLNLGEIRTRVDGDEVEFSCSVNGTFSDRKKPRSGELHRLQGLLEKTRADLAELAKRRDRMSKERPPADDMQLLLRNLPDHAGALLDELGSLVEAALLGG